MRLVIKQESMDCYFKEILCKDEPVDPFYVKQIKTLRTKIVHLIESSGKKVIGVTSAIDGEGKTTMSLRLAASLAANGDRRVLLVDCDLIKSDLTELLGFNGNMGLSDYLGNNENKKDILFKKFPLENLFFITSGNPVPNSSELLTKNIFKNLIDVIRREFDVVVLDLPPVVSTPDPVSVKEFIDGYIIVYLTGKTPRELLGYSIEEIGTEKIFGIVFNKAKKRSIQKYKSKYYYYMKE